MATLSNQFLSPEQVQRQQIEEAQEEQEEQAKQEYNALKNELSSFENKELTYENYATEYSRLSDEAKKYVTSPSELKSTEQYKEYSSQKKAYETEKAKIREYNQAVKVLNKLIAKGKWNVIGMEAQYGSSQMRSLARDAIKNKQPLESKELPVFVDAKTGEKVYMSIAPELAKKEGYVPYETYNKIFPDNKQFSSQVNFDNILSGTPSQNLNQMSIAPDVSGGFFGKAYSNVMTGYETTRGWASAFGEQLRGEKVSDPNKIVGTREVKYKDEFGNVVYYDEAVTKQQARTEQLQESDFLVGLGVMGAGATPKAIMKPFIEPTTEVKLFGAVEKTDDFTELNVLGRISKKGGKDVYILESQMMKSDGSIIGGVGKGYKLKVSRSVNYPTSKIKTRFDLDPYLSFGKSKEVGVGNLVKQSSDLKASTNIGKGYLSKIKTYMKGGKDSSSFGSVIKQYPEESAYRFIGGDPLMRIYKGGKVSYVIKEPSVQGVIWEVKKTTEGGFKIIQPSGTGTPFTIQEQKALSNIAGSIKNIGESSLTKPSTSFNYGTSGLIGSKSLSFKTQTQEIIKEPSVQVLNKNLPVLEKEKQTPTNYFKSNLSFKEYSRESPKLRQPQLTKIRSKEILKPTESFKTKQTPTQRSGSILKSVSKSKLKQIEVPKPTAFSMNILNPKQTSGGRGTTPLFPFKVSLTGSNSITKPSKPLKPSTEYQADLASLAFNIRAPKIPKSYKAGAGGVSFRPIIKLPSEKKRKKKRRGLFNI